MGKCLFGNHPLWKTCDSVQKFKTNLQCRNCVRAVSGFFQEVSGIISWEVDTDHPDKVLTIIGNGVSTDVVLKALDEAGFEGQVIEEVAADNHPAVSG
jgi:copper chaperone